MPRPRGSLKMKEISYIHSEAYAAGEIIRLAEGSLATVSCLKGEKNGCEKAGHCRALPLWKGLDLVVDEYLDSVSLADLQKMEEN